MGEILLGHRRVKYSVIRKQGVEGQKISLTPDSIQVIVPDWMDDGEVETYVRRRQAWIEENLEVLSKNEELEVWPQQFRSGSKVLFMGRMRPVFFRYAGVEQVEIARTAEGIEMTVPVELVYGQKERVFKEALIEFYEAYLKEQITEMVIQFAVGLHLEVPKVRVEEMESDLGYFDSDGSLVFNSALILVPKFALDYVVLHELAHVKAKGHRETQKELIAKHLPDYQLRAQWLKQHAPLVRAGF